MYRTGSEIARRDVRKKFPSDPLYIYSHCILYIASWCQMSIRNQCTVDFIALDEACEQEVFHQNAHRVTRPGPLTLYPP